MHDHCNAPMCQKCNRNKAQWTGKISKSGLYQYRTRIEDGVGIYICAGCHKRYYRKKTEANWTFGRRNGHSRKYIKHRKNYCENIDSRLGFKCEYPITNPDYQLSVDHIRENFGEENADDIENLQTLCHNCHHLKSYYARTRNYDKLYDMIEMIYKTKNENKTTEELLKILEEIK